MLIAVLLISALIGSWLGVYCIRSYALKYLLDVPNRRSSHRVPTPRGGGLSIVLTFALVVLTLLLAGRLGPAQLAPLAWGVLIAAVGFWDDHRHIPAWRRLTVHFVAAIGALYCIGGMPPVPIGGVSVALGSFGYMLGVLYLIWLLNLFNFMDGIDGIAVSEVVFVAGALTGFLSAVDAGLSMIAVSLAVSSIGFLFWNWPPARIFMGDVGSGFLGFVLGVLVLQSAWDDPLFLAVGTILMAVFIVDASYTLAYRLFSGQKWYQAHRCHAYQHAAGKFGHLKVLGALWTINLFYLLPIAVLVFRYPSFQGVGLLAAYLPLLYLAIRFGAGRVHADV